MIQEDDLDLDTEGTQAAPGSKSKLLIIAVVVVLVLGVSATATLMLTGVLSGGEQAVADQTPADTRAAGKGKEAVAKVRAPINYVPMDPPFVVNFSGDTDIRFLQITVEVGTRDPEMVEPIKEQRPAIRNGLVMLFSNQDPYELNTREGKEKLRANALAEIQKVMKQETGRAGVESVFFTSFVMQ
jgi:flagellar protein FliL